MQVKTGNRRGSNLIEFSLLAPWFIFLFVGIFDFGFYTYALESTTAGAVAAANYCAASSTNCSAASYAAACQLALDSVQYLSNVGAGQTNCSAPVSMSVTPGTDATYLIPYVSVTFNYTTPILIPIPGLLPDQLTITRTVVLALGQTV